MRTWGKRSGLAGMQPCDHVGWVYRGRDQFTDLAGQFLREGVTLGQKLMYVADEPELNTPEGLEGVLETGSLVVASISDVYGPSGIVDATQQQATFAAALATAMAEGFTGIRVVADNTPLVMGEREFEAWTGWECVADRFMARNPVIGLCAFDGERVEGDRLCLVAGLHPLLSMADAARGPLFRMFVDDNSLRVQGVLDDFAVRMLFRALRAVPEHHNVVIDLRNSELMDSATACTLAGADVDIVIVAGPQTAGAAVEEMRSAHPTLTFVHSPVDDGADAVAG